MNQTEKFLLGALSSLLLLLGLGHVGEASNRKINEAVSIRVNTQELTVIPRPGSGDDGPPASAA